MNLVFEKVLSFSQFAHETKEDDDQGQDDDEQECDPTNARVLQDADANTSVNSEITNVRLRDYTL